MKKRAVVILCLWLAPFIVQAADNAVSLKVGETWIYQHTGPRPWSGNRDPIYGDRTVKVLSEKGEGAEKAWVLKETWGTYDDSPTNSTIDTNGMMGKLELGYSDVLTFAPAVPTRFINLLKPGEEKTYESKITTNDGDELPYTIMAHRVDDENVTVPAGTFDRCQHYQNKVQLTFSNDQGKITITLHHDLWLHAKVNGMVKETYEFESLTVNGEQREGSKSTSVLKEYRVETN